MEYRLGDLYTVSNGLSKSGECFGTGNPFLTFSTVFNNFFIPKELKALVQSTPKEQNTFSIKAGDVFITRTSETTEELGMSCVALVDYPQATYNGFCKRLRPITDLSYPLYMGYYFRTAYFRSNFLKVASLITRASLRNEDLLKFKVSLPHIDIQKKIANILFRYDTLIENNNRRIQLLEQMAENLYKEWFVRFRFPGHETAEFENGLPKGWRVEKLSNVFEIKYGKDHKNIEDGNVPIFGSGGIMRYGDRALYSGESVLIPRKGSLNNVMYYNGDFWTVDTMFYTKLKIEHCAKYAYFTLSKVDFEGLNSGASIPSMTTDILYHLKMIIPDPDTLLAFDQHIEMFFSEKKLLLSNNDNLIKQRDMLLPRLMSGKLEV